MGFAINASQDGFRTVDAPSDVLAGETYSATQPTLAPSAAEIQATMTEIVQAHLDVTAQAHGYDGILSACTYATSANATFKAEALACAAWRDAVWTACYAELAVVQAGTAQAPTEAALIASLPAITWP